MSVLDARDDLDTLEFQDLNPGDYYFMAWAGGGDKLLRRKVGMAATGKYRSLLVEDGTLRRISPRDPVLPATGPDDTYEEAVKRATPKLTFGDVEPGQYFKSGRAWFVKIQNYSTHNALGYGTQKMFNDDAEIEEIREAGN